MNNLSIEENIYRELVNLLQVKRFKVITMSEVA